MNDHKAEWYLKRNAELTKALLKMKRMCHQSKYYPINSVKSFIYTGAIIEIVDKLDLESGWTPSKVDDKDGTVSK